MIALFDAVAVQLGSLAATWLAILAATRAGTQSEHPPRNSENLCHLVSQRYKTPRLAVTARKFRESPPRPLPFLRDRRVQRSRCWRQLSKNTTQSNRTGGLPFTTGGPRAEIPRIVVPNATRIVNPTGTAARNSENVALPAAGEILGRYGGFDG
jgi:hypothetical protein